MKKYISRFVLIELDKWFCLNSVTHMPLTLNYLKNTKICYVIKQSPPIEIFIIVTKILHQYSILQQLSIYTDEMKGERDEQHEKALSVRDVQTFARSKTNIDCIKENK